MGHYFGEAAGTTVVTATTRQVVTGAAEELPTPAVAPVAATAATATRATHDDNSHSTALAIQAEVEELPSVAAQAITGSGTTAAMVAIKKKGKTRKGKRLTEAKGEI